MGLSLRLFGCSLLLLSLVTAKAETIEFPDEELATESVLPIFDNARSVLSRNVKTEGRFEFGAGGGLALNEPFYNPMNFNVQGSYHFDETHGVNFFGIFFMDGMSSYGNQLRDEQDFDPSRAPAPKYGVLGSYQFDAFYGKISLTKKSVMNLSLFGIVGAGMIGLDEGSAVALNVGFGQKFYFGNRVALRLDFRVLAFEGPDPTSNTTNMGPSDPLPSASDFDDELFFNTYLTADLVFLL